MPTPIRIPLHVFPPQDAQPGTARRGEPITCGIPFARGTLGAGSTLVLLDGTGGVVPLQWLVLNRWPDESARWVLLDFAANQDVREAEWTLIVQRGTNAETREPLATRTSAGRVTVRTPLLECMVPGREGLLEIRRSEAGFDTMIVELHDEAGRAHRIDFSDQTIETSGPLRSAVAVAGRTDLNGRELRVTARLNFFASAPAVRVEVTLHNPSPAQHPGNYWELGDPGSVVFKGMTVRCGRRAGPDVISAFVSEQRDAPSRLHQLPLHVYQESSGGDHWQSPVHLNRDNRVSVRFRGYTLTSGDGSADGLRAEPIVTAGSGSDSISAYLCGFWQEFPSALAAADDGSIVISPFPVEFGDRYELQGGERKTRIFAVEFGADPVSTVPLDWVRGPAWARADPEYYCGSGVVPWLRAEGDPRHDALLGEALDGPASFTAKREAIDEYGWRNFGDIYADHEAALGTSPAFVSHYNNQYDAIAGFAQQFMRTGDRRWWQLMDDLARHVADIDIYHTTGDKAAFNGGLFWHSFHYVEAGLSTHRSYPRAPGVSGGGPSAEHNYNAGLALDYFLTGWIPARDAALSLSDWVLTMDDGQRTKFRWLARGATGLASASGNPLYHGPGRAGGNSIKALLIGFELAGRRQYLLKAEELIRRCINPRDDIHALDLLDAERRWYYTVFLEALGVYLWQKVELGELDEMYAYARLALVHYARWMCANEYPYLDRPEILEYPNETWSAQDIRKSEVLALAALCSEGVERTGFLGHSRRFFEDVFTRLPAMPTHRYTRPMVLMLTRGYAFPWAQLNEASLPQPDRAFEDLPPLSFEPQKVRAVRRAKLLAGVLFLCVVFVLMWIAVK